LCGVALNAVEQSKTPDESVSKSATQQDHIPLRQAKPVTEIKVKIGAPESDKVLLLEKLNEHGARHHLHFTSVQEGFDYRVVFGTQQPSSPWVGNTSAAGVSAYDPEGRELFRFSRSNRATDTGATNAAAKEIVKRILRWQQQGKP
jgi:hypothetical protein